MMAYFRIGTDGNATVFYNVDSKKLRSLIKQYKKGGWTVTDKGEQGEVFRYRLIELS